MSLASEACTGFSNILGSWGGHNKVLWIGQLEQQSSIFSRFWRPEVQGHGASRTGFIRRPVSLVGAPLLLARSPHRRPWCARAWVYFPLLGRRPGILDCEILIIIHWLLMTTPILIMVRVPKDLILT